MISCQFYVHASSRNESVGMTQAWQQKMFPLLNSYLWKCKAVSSLLSWRREGMVKLLGL